MRKYVMIAAMAAAVIFAAALPYRASAMTISAPSGLATAVAAVDPVENVDGIVTTGTGTTGDTGATIGDTGIIGIVRIGGTAIGAGGDPSTTARTIGRAATSTDPSIGTDRTITAGVGAGVGTAVGGGDFNLGMSFRLVSGIRAIRGEITMLGPAIKRALLFLPRAGSPNAPTDDGLAIDAAIRPISESERCQSGSRTTSIRKRARRICAS